MKINHIVCNHICSKLHILLLYISEFWLSCTLHLETSFLTTFRLHANEMHTSTLWLGMIMGAATSSVYYNLKLRHPTLDMPIIDYDLALLIQPMLMLGISIGVAFNVIFADWMVTVLLIILFLGKTDIGLPCTSIPRPFSSSYWLYNDLPGFIMICRDINQGILERC